MKDDRLQKRTSTTERKRNGMPNGHDHSKRYGKHSYPETGLTSMRECAHGCGCYVASSTSGDPLGIDPFGECPNNPENGERLSGDADQKIIVERRIRRGEEAIARLARLSKPKRFLETELNETRERLSWYVNFIYQLRLGLAKEPEYKTTPKNHES